MTFVGEGRQSVGIDRWPLMGHRPQFLSKNLQVQVSAQGGVGWTFDEISLRVEVDGRWASLPIRLSFVFVRDVDRWVLVMDHWSYPLSVTSIEARTGVALENKALPLYRQSTNADMLIALIGRLENGEQRAKEKRSVAPHRAVLVHPQPGGEYHGDAIGAAPTLADLFEGKSVGIRDYRIESESSGTVAWMAANLVVSGRSDSPFEISLRASYVFEHTSEGWKVVLTHVSVPLKEGYLNALVFGK